MRLKLMDFQEQYLDEFVGQLRNAGREAGTSPQAVSLSAPTGSGKTVIATAAIERLFFGEDDRPGDPEAVVLWITDQPELNRQTQSRMQEYSDQLLPDRLVEIEEGSFDQEELEPGHVYFLNTQKLGTNSRLVRSGDSQEYTLWDTFQNTLSSRAEHWYVMIDEAHRGMGEGRNRSEATTIIQKFIKGSPGELTPVPLVAGISATLERFNSLLEGTSRVRRAVEVPPEAVRESGLIKERIVMNVPPDSADPELTLLGMAAQATEDYQVQWAAYTSAEGIDPVNPLLVVQVEDGTGKKVSNTDLAAALDKVESVLGSLTDQQVGHAFDVHSPADFGTRAVRYVAPSDIDADSDLRVVFFKKSLSVGWDCPRAEVMMSFRPARDATLIAQLIGRMVRSPLARRIGTNEHLNSVSVCLPRYDRAHVDQIISYLTDPQNAALDEDSIQPGAELATLSRAAESDAAFDELEKLPSYVIPRSTRTRQVERLRRLAQRLSDDEIYDDAPDEARSALIEVLDQALGARESSKAFKTAVAKAGQVSVQAYEWAFGEAGVTTGDTAVVDLDSSDLSRVFEAVGKRLGDVFKPWWRHRISAGVARDQARQEVIALGMDPDVVAALDSAASDLVDKWLATYGRRIADQSDEAQQAYDQIRGGSEKPALAPLAYPDTIEIRRDDSESAFGKHLYVDADGTFPGKLNRWERQIITAEIDRDETVAWLRNEPRKRGWSLAVPYVFGGETKPMYPDLLVVRRDEGGDLVVDILDPHTTSLNDAPAKAVGLAEFARDHGGAFGRIELIIIERSTNRVFRLDLQKSSARTQVLTVRTPEHLEALYSLAEA